MDIEILLTSIDQAFDRKSWHGTNLRGSIRAIDLETATWRPSPARHNIWEIVVHAAYWKYVVKRRITGEKRGSFPLKGSNFFPRPVAAIDDAAQWKSDVGLLSSMHRELRLIVETLTPLDLSKPAHGVTRRYLISFSALPLMTFITPGRSSFSNAFSSVDPQISSRPAQIEAICIAKLWFLIIA